MIKKLCLVGVTIFLGSMSNAVMAATDHRAPMILGMLDRPVNMSIVSVEGRQPYFARELMERLQFDSIQENGTIASTSLLENNRKERQKLADAVVSRAASAGAYVTDGEEAAPASPGGRSRATNLATSSPHVRDSDAASAYTHGNAVAATMMHEIPGDAEIKILPFLRPLFIGPRVGTNESLEVLWGRQKVLLDNYFTTLIESINSHNIPIFNISMATELPSESIIGTQGEDVAPGCFPNIFPNFNPLARIRNALGRGEQAQAPDDIGKYKKQIANYFNQGIKKVITSCPGTLFVLAAGNHGVLIDPKSKATANLKAKNLIKVGSFNVNDYSLSSFSNYSPKILDVLAPGEDVRVNIQYLEENLEFYRTGTSFATPIVTNALMKLLFNRPELNNPEKLKEAFFSDLKPKKVAGGRASENSRAAMVGETLPIGRVEEISKLSKFVKKGRVFVPFNMRNHEGAPFNPNQITPKSSVVHTFHGSLTGNPHSGGGGSATSAQRPSPRPLAPSALPPLDL